ncbi:MAG: hypothetical protein HQL77_02105 [Magnetococcales bacterium]|nr:hypothetical protein [Magnetococcales bacterium]MBF0434148.1 hypothetical protein [Magnetococcales bacterium]
MAGSLTLLNFADVHKNIQFMIDHYRINIEKWVVDQFNDISNNPSDSAVMALRLWMERFLTPRQQLEIFESVEKNFVFSSILLSRETVERMDSVRKHYGLENMEATVVALLDCVRRHPLF